MAYNYSGGPGYPPEKGGEFQYSNNFSNDVKGPPSYNNAVESASSSGGRLFYIIPSPADPHLVNLIENLSPDGYPLGSPIYSVRVNTKAKPHVVVARGSMSQGDTMASADFHTWSGKIDLTVFNEEVSMKQSKMAYKYYCELPIIGTCEWKTAKSTGTTPTLYDANEKPLAKMEGSGTSGMFGGAGERRLEIYGPIPSSAYLDYVVVSAMVVWQKIKVTNATAATATVAGLAAT